MVATTRPLKRRWWEAGSGPWGRELLLPQTPTQRAARPPLEAPAGYWRGADWLMEGVGNGVENAPNQSSPYWRKESGVGGKRSRERRQQYVMLFVKSSLMHRGHMADFRREGHIFLLWGWEWDDYTIDYLRELPCHCNSISPSWEWVRWVRLGVDWFVVYRVIFKKWCETSCLLIKKRKVSPMPGGVSRVAWQCIRTSFGKIDTDVKGGYLEGILIYPT